MKRFDIDIGKRVLQLNQDKMHVIGAWAEGEELVDLLILRAAVKISAEKSHS